MTASDVLVRGLVGTDRAGWDRLWQGYLAFYDEHVDDETTDIVFQRLIDGGYPALTGVVAVLRGELVGLAHVQVHPSTWAVAEDCYLEDLFVDPGARGTGVGRALIEHLAAEGREAGWRKIHWLTDEDNETARRLYDAIGVVGEQVLYTLDLT